MNIKEEMEALKRIKSFHEEKVELHRARPTLLFSVGGNRKTWYNLFQCVGRYHMEPEIVAASVDHVMPFVSQREVYLGFETKNVYHYYYDNSREPFKEWEIYELERPYGGFVTPFWNMSPDIKRKIYRYGNYFVNE